LPSIRRIEILGMEYCPIRSLRHLDMEYLSLLVMDVFNEVRAQISRIFLIDTTYSVRIIRRIGCYN
ncbi:hypothetical protein Tco_0571900, partial [Tanacetum coccineum]